MLDQTNGYRTSGRKEDVNMLLTKPDNQSVLPRIGWIVNQNGCQEMTFSGYSGEGWEAAYDVGNYTIWQRKTAKP
jgi:hypothetical protein